MFTSPRTSCSSSSLLTMLWTTLSHARMSIMILNLINRSVNTRAECSARQEINSSSLLLCSQLYPLRFFVRFASLVLCRIHFVVWVEKTTISISTQCLSCIHILCSINIYRLPDNDSLSHSTIRLVFTISIEMMMMMRATRKWFTFFPSSCMLFIKVFQSSAYKIYVEREKRRWAEKFTNKTCTSYSFIVVVAARHAHEQQRDDGSRKAREFLSFTDIIYLY